MSMPSITTCRCSACAGFFSLEVLVDVSLAGIEWELALKWSDGFCAAVPRPPDVVRCPHCATVVWLGACRHDAQDQPRGVHCELLSGGAQWSAFRAADAAVRASTAHAREPWDPFLDAFAAARETGSAAPDDRGDVAKICAEHARPIRQSLALAILWECNAPFRAFVLENFDAMLPPSQEGISRRTQVLAVLIEEARALQAHSPAERIRLAEWQRESGAFSKAIETLEAPFDDPTLSRAAATQLALSRALVRFPVPLG